MSEKHAELMHLVRELLEEYSKEHLWWCIQECHNGKLHSPIGTDNLHLFRRYRNDPVHGSSDAQRMIDAALSFQQLRCTDIESNDGSMMFHTGGVYTTQKRVNRSVEVIDDLGYPRVFVVEDGKAKFCIGHRKLSIPFEDALYAHFEELGYGDAS